MSVHPIKEMPVIIRGIKSGLISNLYSSATIPSNWYLFLAVNDLAPRC